MRHLYTLIIAACALTLAVSCSDDDPVEAGGGDNGGVFNNADNSGNNAENSGNNAQNNANNNGTGGNNADNSGSNNATGGNNTQNNATANNNNNNIENPLPLSDEAIGDFCDDTCSGIASPDGCGDAAALDACRLECVDSVSANGQFAANFACWQNTCDREVCFDGDDPIALDDECADACAALDGCDLLRFVDLPEDEPGFCHAICSGDAFANGAVQEAVSCINDRFDAETCDEDSLDACFTFNPLCDDICATILTNEESDEYCAPESDVQQSWGSAEACVADCETIEDGGDRLTWFACLVFNNCGDPAECDDVPTEPFDGCVDACEALDALCVNSPNELDNVATCSELCTGFLAGADREGAREDAGACVEALDTCPPEDEQFGALFGCVLPINEACVNTCAALRTCGLPVDEEGSCDVGCSQIELSDPETFEQLTSCVEDSSSCMQTTRCLQELTPDAPRACEEHCARLGECGEAPDRDACLRACVESLEDDQAFVAVMGCQALVTCDNLDTCRDAQDTDPAIECIEACNDEPQACSDVGEGACPYACSGALTALEISGAEAAQCVVDDLRRRCEFENAPDCASP